MFSNTIALPEGGRSRIIGKSGAKIKDIRDVSGATVLVTINNVNISSQTKEGEAMATSLVEKAILHMTAAGNSLREPVQVFLSNSQLSLEADVKMAVYFTYNRD
jgi:DNA-binding CsgD family transcriptional regulator